MITFLWMLYLALTLYLTIGFINKLILYDSNQLDLSRKNELTVQLIVNCLLWSIWYFYFLH